jgi:hypothetical protein
MMNLNTIKLGGANLLGRSGLLLKKYSPEILTTIGVVGVVGTAVLASRATLKLEPIIEKFNTERGMADYEAEEEILQTGTYDRKQHAKAMSKVYLDTGVELTKLYGPTISVGVTSIVCILAAHGIMQKRAVALAAAYKALESTFVEYRKRVVDAIGENKEEDIRLGRKTVEVTDENGKTKKVTTTDPQGLSPYAKFFDEYSENWSKTPEYNFLFLKAQQNYANDLLHSRGHVFLNEVYDMLGIPRTQAGQVVGWVISKDGDNFVDFGMYDHASDSAHAFINGYERSILLDFNVDGVIYDMI